MTTDDLIKFVDRIESRKGMASIEEIFVEMITIAQYFLQMDSYDRYTHKVGSRLGENYMRPNKQLERMWKDLQILANQYKKNKESKPYEGCQHSDEICPCGKETIYFSPIFKFTVCFNCLYESSKSIPPRWGVTTKCRICKVGPRICTDKYGKPQEKINSYCSYCMSQMMRRNRVLNENRAKVFTDKPCVKCKIKSRYITPKGNQKSRCEECYKMASNEYNRMRYWSD